MKRERNEDSVLADSNLKLYVVADGMGGHAGGAIASQMAVATVRSAIQDAWHKGEIAPDASNTEQPNVLRLLDRSIREASRRIFDASSSSTELHGMGTTVTLTLFLGKRCYVAHVGDSRLYRIRNGSGMEQMTEDHSLVAEQVKAGFITAEEAQYSRFRNIITRSVGFESSVSADTFSLPTEEGDVFLMCSDGLTGMVTDEGIEEILGCKTLREALNELIDLANRNGGEDNISLVLLRFKGNRGRAGSRLFRRLEARRKRHHRSCD